MTDSNILFNMCPRGETPDWTQFDALEIGGCVNDSEEGSDETHYIGGIEREHAEIFTIYGHFRPECGQGVDAITDCATFEDAEIVAKELAILSGLPVHVVC